MLELGRLRRRRSRSSRPPSRCADASMADPSSPLSAGDPPTSARRAVAGGDPGRRRFQRVRRRRRPDGRVDDAAPDHRRPRTGAARRSRRRGVDRQRLSDRLRRGDADRRSHQRRDRPTAHVRRRLRAVPRRLDPDPASTSSTSVRLVPLRARADRARRRGDGARGTGRDRRRVPRSTVAPGRSARSARSRRSAGCGVRCTARCWCGSCRGSGSSGSTSRSRSVGWSRVVVGARRPRPPGTHGARIDWLGAALLTVTLVSLNMALLGSAEIQSVNGSRRS